MPSCTTKQTFRHLLLAPLVLLIFCGTTVAQQKKAVKKTEGTTLVYQGKKYIDQAYTATKQSPSKVSDYTRIIQLCGKGTQLGVSKKSATYATKLMAWAHNRRGRIYFEATSRTKQGSATLALEQKALSDFETSLSLDNARWNAHYYHGMCMARMEKYEEAIADFNRTIELRETFSRAHFNRGQVYYLLGNNEKAVADYSSAIKHNSSDDEAFNSRGHARSRLGLFREALADYDQAVKLNPRSAPAYTNRGDAYADQGRYENAARDYRHAIQLDPKFGRAYQSAAWLMATCPDARYRDKVRAVSAAKKAIALDGGEDYHYMDSLAAAYASAGKFDEAKSVLEGVINVAPASEKETLKKRLAIYEQGKPYREAAREVSQKPTTRPRK